MIIATGISFSPKPMPELPEVEVTRQRLAARVEGALVTGCRVGKPLRWPLGCDLRLLTGRRVLTLSRRGKYLLMHLDAGLLLWHLGMSGSLALAGPDSPAGPHDHFDLRLSGPFGNACLRLTDPRRFGAVVHVTGLDDPRAQRLLGGLGPEPLAEEDFTVGGFRRALAGRRLAIKPALMAGDMVVGVGNIYACEALFRARIAPQAAAGSLGAARVTRLHAAVREVLAEAVRRGGSSLRDFSVNGVAGHYQESAAVYGRAGEPCRDCGATIRLIRQGQRSTFYCPKCQKR